MSTQVSSMLANTSEIHRWTRKQYDCMVAAGIFYPDVRVELIDGYIVDMSPQSSVHAVTVQLVEEALRLAFPKGYSVRTQMPLALDDMSEPEPDVAVVPGSPRDYLDDHPTAAVLIVEVARVSLGIDQSLKKSLYARNGIEDYWIVNLDASRVEVYRQPQGDSYRSERRLYRGDTIQPLAQPQYSIPVTELLP